MNEPFPNVSRFAHEAMTTIFEIFISDPDGEYAGQAARAAFREIDRLEGLFNRFDPGSEISRINRLPGGEEIPVGIETFECLSLAESVRRETGGAFDINARAAIPGSSAGSPDSLPSPGSAERATAGRENSGFTPVSEPGGFFIRRPEAFGPREEIRLDLDLGGVGKGYAVDRAMDVLVEWGVSGALIHGGTSTALARGSADPADAPGSDRKTGWPVGAGAGWAGAPPHVILTDRALSGSGTEVKGGHILDPRTGRAARGNLAAWASTPSAALSDALSTAFFVMSPDDVEAFSVHHPDTWACLVVSYRDVRTYNPGLLPGSFGVL